VSIALASFSVALGVRAGGIGDFLGSAVNTTVHVVTAPTQTLVNAVQAATGSKPPSAVLDPAKNLGKSAGATLSQGVAIAAAPQETLYQEAQKAVSNVGPGAEFVFDVATFAQRHQDELAKASGQAAANILQQQNPLQIVSIPLAAAIREGRERFDSKAQPLPDDVKEGLEGFYAAGVLERARYAVGKLEITLPNGIGQLQKFGDTNYAVVVDDIIVFNVQPPAFRDNPWWWGHEVTHVEQYKQMGIEEFARRYVFSGGADLENPANRRGDQVLAAAKASGTATALAINVRKATDVASKPLYPAAFAPTAQNSNPPPPPASLQDPAVIQAVFPGDPRPLNFLVTQTGRILVVDRFSGQWLQIGWAIPPTIPNVAWHYQAGGVFYDVFPNGQIWTRFTPYGPQQVGFVVRL
jgi:hypothetical protein